MGMGVSNPALEFAFPVMLSGECYDGHWRSRGSIGATGQTANRLMAHYFFCDTITHFSALEFEVTTAAAAGAKARIGVYTCNKNTFYPESLLFDSGEVATDAIGIISAACNLTLSVGMYALAILPDTNFTARGVFLGTVYPAWGGYPATWGTTGKANCVYGAFAFAALPNNYPAGQIKAGIAWPVRLRVA